jgi:hypothetical protein
VTGVLEWTLRLVGVFYAVGALVVLHTTAVGRMVDGLLDRLEALDVSAGTGSDEDDPPRRRGSERVKTIVLTASAVLMFAAGLALAALSRTAPPLMLASAVAQGAWLIAAKRWYPPETAVEAEGRAASQRATMGFLAATAFVLIAESTQSGLWRQGGEIWLAVAVAAVAIVAASGRSLDPRPLFDALRRGGGRKDDGGDG